MVNIFDRRIQPGHLCLSCKVEGRQFKPASLKMDKKMSRVQSGKKAKLTSWLLKLKTQANFSEKLGLWDSEISSLCVNHLWAGNEPLERSLEGLLESWAIPASQGLWGIWLRTLAQGTEIWIQILGPIWVNMQLQVTYPFWDYAFLFEK